MLYLLGILSGFALANALEVQPSNLHSTYELLKTQKGTKVPTVSSNSTSKRADEYYVTTVYTTPNCASNSAYTATGYRLGACISAGGESSYMYTDCSESGSTTYITMTSCTSTDCSSGCSSFKIPQEGACKSLSTFKCESGEPWVSSNFNYHMEIFWNADSCDGAMDTWTAISVAEEDCNSWDCKEYEGDGTHYSYKGSCDM